MKKYRLGAHEVDGVEWDGEGNIETFVSRLPESVGIVRSFHGDFWIKGPDGDWHPMSKLSLESLSEWAAANGLD